MDISKLLDFFYNMTRLDILAADREGRTVAEVRTLERPRPLEQPLLDHERELLDRAADLQPGQHRQEFIPVFHVYYLQLRTDEETRLLVGPYTYQDVPADTVSQVMRAYSVPKTARDECSRFYLTVPKNFRSVPLSASLLLTLFRNGLAESEAAAPTERPTSRATPPRRYGALQAIRNADYQYAEEDRIRAAVRNGNTEAAQRCLSLGAHRFEYRSDSVSMWHMQHMLAVLGTVMRLAAREGGASPHVLHEISERYFFLIPACKGSGDGDRLLSRMAEEYCRAVRDAEAEPCSPITRAALAYLHDHSREHIAVQDIAAAVHCHPTYLCGLFKREVKSTLIRTLTDIRIDYAVGLLSDPTRSVAQIYREAGFESYQRFSAAFKQRFGCSCSQWRKGLPKGSDQ